MYRGEIEYEGRAKKVVRIGSFRLFFLVVRNVVGDINMYILFSEIKVL